jgi:hypothetical protein
VRGPHLRAARPPVAAGPDPRGTSGRPRGSEAPARRAPGRSTEQRRRGRRLTDAGLSRRGLARLAGGAGLGAALAGGTVLGAPAPPAARAAERSWRQGGTSAASLAAAFAAPETGVNADGWYYGTGRMVRPVSGGGRNTWHDGGLDGTSTRMVRTHDGKGWAVLFNQRDDPSGLSYSAIDGLLWTASRQVEPWPAHDLYDRYFPA